MSAPKPARGVRLADENLSTHIRGLLTKVRNDLGPYGWSVYVDQRGKQLSFEFRNPLSPVSTGMVFDPSRSIADIRKELAEHLNGEPEFAHTKLATPPRRKRNLIGGIRWAATSYGWSQKVFQEVIDTLRGFKVLSEDEWQWLKTVGPDVLQEDLKREWQKHVKAHERRPRRDIGVGSKTSRSS
jgi:hypothetical protein